MIAPGCRVRRSVHQRTNHLLPIETFRNAAALEVVPSWKSQEGGMHCSQLLHNIDAVSVRPVMIGRREQGNQLEPERSWTVDRQFQVVFGRGLDIARQIGRASCRERV